MFQTLFGTGMPISVRFLLAFLIVLGLIGATAWAVRRFGTGRPGTGGVRGRQPRLAVVDYATVDGRRRLILIRRDNVEHLLMIGGPSDIVVEPNIVRAVAAAPREVTLPRPPAPVETLPRAVSLTDNGANGSWPLQPEPAGGAAPPQPAPRPARVEPTPEEPTVWPLQRQTETSTRAQRDTLAALADELSTRPAPPRNRAASNPQPLAAERRPEGRPEPRVVPAPPSAGAEPAVADQSLAEMAHRLEAALRKPGAKTEARDAREGRPPAAPRLAAVGEPAAQAEPATPAPAAPARPVEAKPLQNTKPQGKALYDSLEQEMASLLGRPTGKS
jgi:flagellar protein FliO/FliZ